MVSSDKNEMVNGFYDSHFPIRSELSLALSGAWLEVARPGAWLTGEQRLAVAMEARHAWSCKLCQSRKEALSPYTVDGRHDCVTELPLEWIEVIHRIVTDPGRITEGWYDSVIAAGVLEDEYIEILSLATIVTCVDVFARGLGAEELSLPESAGAGEPARSRPVGAAIGPGWSPTVAPEDAGPELGDFYVQGHQYIRRSLTLVPDELDRFWRLMNSLYMANPAVTELEGVERSISRGQIEFIATRVSAHLDCFY